MLVFLAFSVMGVVWLLLTLDHVHPHEHAEHELDHMLRAATAHEGT